MGAFASGLLGETGQQSPRGPGRPAAERRALAASFLADLVAGEPKEKMVLKKGLFVRMKSPDAVLAIAGFHSREACYLPSNHFDDAEILRFDTDDDGTSVEGLDMSEVAKAHVRMQVLVLVDDPALTTFFRRVV